MRPLVFFLLIAFLSFVADVSLGDEDRSAAMTKEFDAALGPHQAIRKETLMSFDEQRKTALQAKENGDAQEVERLLGQMMEFCLSSYDPPYLLQKFVAVCLRVDSFEYYFKAKLMLFEFADDSKWPDSFGNKDGRYLEDKIRALLGFELPLEWSEKDARIAYQIDKTIEDEKVKHERGMQKIYAEIKKNPDDRTLFIKARTLTPDPVPIETLEVARKIQNIRLRNEYIVNIVERTAWGKDGDGAEKVYDMLEDPYRRDLVLAKNVFYQTVRRKNGRITGDRYDNLAELPTIRNPIARIVTALDCCSRANTALWERKPSFCAYQSALVSYAIKTANETKDDYVRAYGYYLIDQFLGQHQIGIFCAEDNIVTLMLQSVERLSDAAEKKSFEFSIDFNKKLRNAIAALTKENEQEQWRIDNISRHRKEADVGGFARFDELRDRYGYIRYLVERNDRKKLFAAVDELNEVLLREKYIDDLRKAADINVALGRYDQAIELTDQIIAEGWRNESYREFISATLLKGNVKEAKKMAGHISDETLRDEILSKIKHPENADAPWLGIGGYSELETPD